MKRIFLLCFLLTTSTVWAWAGIGFMGGGSPPDVSCDNCSGALKFAWHMEDNDATPDVTLGNPCGCSDGDTIGAETGSPVFSTTQKSDGSYSLHINALDEYYQFAVTGDDLIEADNVKMTFDIYVVSYPGGVTYICFCEAYYNASNLIRMQVKGDGTITMYYKGNDISSHVAVTVSTGSWVSCEYQAKTGIAGNDHYLLCGGNSDEDDDDLGAFPASASSLKLGDSYGDGVGEYYLDNVKIYPCDRY